MRGVDAAAELQLRVRTRAHDPIDGVTGDGHIDMPGMTGIQLLERVRARDLDVPVVLVTGNPSVETAIKAMEQGALRYLVKPVELEVLVKVALQHQRATAGSNSAHHPGGRHVYVTSCPAVEASWRTPASGSEAPV